MKLSKIHYSVKLILVSSLFLAISLLFVPNVVSPQLNVQAACIAAFQDANRVDLGGNPRAFKAMHLKLTNCNPNGANGDKLRIILNEPNEVIESAADFEQTSPLNGITIQTKTTFTIPRPAGFTFRYEIYRGANLIHAGNASLERDNDPAKLVDGPLNETRNSTSGGCCENNTQCQQWYGPQSTCTGDYNALCQSGRQCKGGARLFENADCEIDESTGVCAADMMCVSTTAGDKCVGPCGDTRTGAALYECLTSRYSFDFTRCPEGCNCGSNDFIGGGESIFPRYTYECASSCNLNTLGANLCFNSGANECEGSFLCTSMTVTGNNNQLQAQVNVGCMPAGQYRLSVFEEIDPTVIASRDFALTSERTISVNLGQVEAESNRLVLEVVGRAGDAEGEKVCALNTAFDGGAPIDPVTPVRPIDTSTDFGSRNCPYAVPCDSDVVKKRYPTIAPILSTLCQQDPAAGVFIPDESPSAKPVADQNAEFAACSKCVKDRGTWTEAFGCIITTPEGVFTALIRIVLGVMGGVALIRITYLGIITAQSDDEGKIAEARKGVIATLAGIALVVLAVLILRVIGVNVLDVVPAGFFGGG